MTDIRVNSAFPAASTGGIKNDFAQVDFLHSLQAISVTEKDSTDVFPDSQIVVSDQSVNNNVSGSVSPEKNAESAESFKSDNDVRGDISSDPDDVKFTTEEQKGTDDFSETVDIPDITDEEYQNGLFWSVQNPFGIGQEQIFDGTDIEFGELLETPPEISDIPQTDTVEAKKPMLDLDRILEKIGNLHEENDLSYVSGKNDLQRPSTENVNVSAIVEEQEIQKNGKAPTIDLEKILQEIENGSDTVETIIPANGPDAEKGNEEVSDKISIIAGEIYDKLTDAVMKPDRGENLEELREKLDNAIRAAVEEMNDPDKQDEELREKIIKFLLEFIEKMNEREEKRNRKTALEDGKETDLGLLTQIIENMVKETDGYSETTSVVYSKPLDTAPVQSIENEPQTNPEMNGRSDNNEYKVPEIKEKSAESVLTDNPENVRRTEIFGKSVRKDHMVIGAVSADESVTEGNENARMISNARKVADAPERDGTIKDPKLPKDELKELQRLVGGRRRLKDFEEDLEDENTEKSGESTDVYGTEKALKNEAVESIFTSSFKTESAPIAKSFEPGENGAKQILTQIVSEVLNNIPKDESTNTIVMMLNPATLGKVTVKISEQAGRISLMVTAHNKETADILASRLDGMQEAMKDSGTQLEKCQVVYSPERNDRSADQNYDGSSKNPYVRQDTEENTDKDGEFSELLRQAV